MTPEYRKRANKKYYEKNKKEINKKSLERRRHLYTTITIPIKLHEILKNLAQINNVSLSKFIAFLLRDKVNEDNNKI